MASVTCGLTVRIRISSGTLSLYWVLDHLYTSFTLLRPLRMAHRIVALRSKLHFTANNIPHATVYECWWRSWSVLEAVSKQEMLCCHYLSLHHQLPSQLQSNATLWPTSNWWWGKCACPTCPESLHQKNGWESNIISHIWYYSHTLCLKKCADSSKL